MRTLVIAAALALLQSGAAVAQYGSYPPQQGRVGAVPGSLRGWGYTPEARIWIEGNRDYYRRGERLRPVFSTSADAYVAVIHIDPDGRLEFLFPSSPFDREYVRAGQSYRLPSRGASAGLVVRGGAGIGYLYLIASPYPLDYGAFRGGAGSAWDWSYAGQSVRGDPFWAMEQITRRLVPDWGYAPVAVDYFSYYIDGIHRYPSYACNSRLGYGTGSAASWGWGWGGGYTPSYYGSCDRLDYYLRDNPYYFDAGRYRGDRRSQFRGYVSQEPQYRYKEDPEARTGTGTARAVAPAGNGSRGGSTTTTAPTRRAAPQPQPERSAPAAAPARGATPSGSTPAVRRVSPGSGGGSAQPGGSQGSGGSGGAGSTTEPRRRSPSE